DRNQEKLRAAGDLDTFLVVDEERKRFIEKQTIPAQEGAEGHAIIMRIALDYHTALVRTKNSYMVRQRNVAIKYHAALEVLIKDLMRRDQIEAAKLALAEVERAKFIADALGMDLKSLQPKQTSPPSPSPDDADTFDGHRYKILSGKTWKEAKRFAEQQGGHLAVVSSQREHAFLVSLLKKADVKIARIGHTDARREGHWEGVTGEKNIYLKWGAGEPKGPLRDMERDVAGLLSNGTMASQPGLHGGTFIVEWPN
ncbi:MAG: C-type lectin domain-containing protein, partial [Kiritimatiellae bacterium]|nr:C-type lectin domain-containing protein [Kiritimatiellia bacterium]